MCIPINTSGLFTNSPDPNVWLENIRILFIIFLVTAVVRSAMSFATFFWYLLAVFIFAVAAWRQRNQIYGLLMLALIPVTLVEMTNFFKNFGKSWTLGFLGVIGSISAILVNLYTFYCAFKMFSDFPSGQRYVRHANDEEDRPVAPHQEEYARYSNL